MVLIRYLAKSVSLLNVLLGALIAAILTYALFPLFSATIPFKPVAGTSGQTGAADKAQPVQVPSPSEYAVIAENNLFHPDRKIPPEKKEVKQLAKPELALHGTVIAGDVSVAYVDDKQAPYSTPGRGKRLRALKIGDVINGFVLKEIEAHRITLVRNEETMTVSLDTAKVRSDEGGRGQPVPPAAQRPTLSTLPPSRAVTPPAAPPAAAPPAAAPLAPAPARPPLPPPPPQRQIRMPTQPAN
jgi:hypothetical protein